MRNVTSLETSSSISSSLSQHSMINQLCLGSDSNALLTSRQKSRNDCNRFASTQKFLLSKNRGYSCAINGVDLTDKDDGDDDTGADTGAGIEDVAVRNDNVDEIKTAEAGVRVETDDDYDEDEEENEEEEEEVVDSLVLCLLLDSNSKLSFQFHCNFI
jgi:hypothetical protein